MATKNELLYSQCKYKSGSKVNDISVCVNTLSQEYFLSVLFSEDLVDHTILELSSILTSTNRDNDILSNDETEKDEAKYHHSNEIQGQNLHFWKVFDSNSFCEILKSFRTSKKKQKKLNRDYMPQKDNEIDPIWKVVFDSDEQKNDIEPIFLQTNHWPKNHIVMFKPKYIDIIALWNEANFNMSDS